MKGINFGNIHSYDDLSLILTSKTIESPQPKVDKLIIPGADGDLDFTEYFGEVKYHNRRLEFNFSTIVPQSQFLALFSEIQNQLHGKKVNIILDDDNQFYYVGRLSCDKWNANKRIGRITIEADCEPYKYKLNETIINKNIVSGTNEIICENLKKSVVPTFVLDSEMTIIFEGNSYVLGQGTFVVPQIEFKQGSNTLNVTGLGTLQIKYQEGCL